MKKKKIMKWIMILMLTILAIPILGIILFLVVLHTGIFLTNPPRPEITYAEFPFRIEIEYNGERLVFEDTLICEFSGFGTSGGIGGNWRRYRQWTSRFESGREYNTVWPSITMLETDYVLVSFDSGEPAFYMDRPWQEVEHGIPWSPMKPSIYVDDLAERARGEFSFAFYDLSWYPDKERLVESLENFGIEVISIEITPPIENTFQ